MNTQTNFTLEERASGHGPAIEREELLDLMAELDAWRLKASRCENIDSPEDLQPVFDYLAANQENPDHADYDDLKDFFDDCVQVLEDESGRWPCAEAYDLNLRQVIYDAIRRGANGEND